MKRQIRTAIMGCSLSLLLVLSSYCATGQQKPETTYNGHWWLSIRSAERTGFLNGYLDCYTYEYKGADRFSSPINTYEDSITHFYKRGPSFELNDSVAGLLRQFRDPAGRVVIDKYAQPATGPHGGDDGLYWMQISDYPGPQLEQRGFVEGYLACHAGLDQNKGGTFPKPAAEYVKLITQWYGFKRDTGDINAKRQPTAIADVLFKFRDQAEAGNTHRK